MGQVIGPGAFFPSELYEIVGLVVPLSAFMLLLERASSTLAPRAAVRPEQAELPWRVYIRMEAVIER